MIKEIQSTQNPYIKSLVQLRFKSRARIKTGQFLIEGAREIGMALKGGYDFETFLFCPEFISLEQISTITGLRLNDSTHTRINLIEVTKEVYEKLAYRSTTQGVLAVARSKDHALDTLELKTKSPLVLVAEAPEKPGNIGALLRTADAAKVDAVIIANPKSDLYNPNIVRSSVGCLFTTEVAVGSTSDILNFLDQHKIRVYCAALEASVPYHESDYTGASAIVVGTESTGLSAEWLDNSHQNIIIPMGGQIDSMNVSVAAGILIFEAKRQRGF